MSSKDPPINSASFKEIPIMENTGVNSAGPFSVVEKGGTSSEAPLDGQFAEPTMNSSVPLNASQSLSTVAKKDDSQLGGVAATENQKSNELVPENAPAAAATESPSTAAQSSFEIEDDTAVKPSDIELGNNEKKDSSGAQAGAATTTTADKPPDGGFQAWFVTFAAFLLGFCSMGLRDAVGVYQRYFVLNNTFPGSSSLSVSFIGAIAAAVWGAVGPITGVSMQKFGFRAVAMFGGVLLMVGYLCASFGTELWMLYLSMGLMVGIAWAAAYFPALSAVPTWFTKHRGLAVGLANCGSGLGGFASANYTQAIINNPNLGWRWALRFNGFISGTLIILAALVIRPWKDLSNRKNRFSWSSILNLGYFKDRRFVGLWCMGFFQCFAFYIPYIFLAQYGASIGLSGSQAALATSMLSIGSTIGRFALSTVADYGGPLNVWAVAQFMATILFLMLPLCQSFGALAAYGVACGLVNGGFVSLYPLCISILMGSHDLPKTMGNVYFSFVFGTLAGAPIGGALIDSHTVFNPDGSRASTDWWPVCIYGFVMTFVSFLFVVYLRMDASKWRLGVKV